MYSLLLADDEELERRSLRLIINKNCPSIDRVLTASSGTRVLEICGRLRPDIVFLDIRMPGLSGLEAARRMKEIHPGVRIVFLTAHSEFDYAQEAIRIGADDFLLKPASDTRVTEVIGRITAVLDAERRKEEDLVRRRRRFEEVTELFTNELLASLLEHPVPGEALRRYFSAMDIPFAGGAAAAFRIDYESYPLAIESAEQSLLLKRRCLLAVRAELEARMIRFLVHEREDIYYVVIMTGGQASAEYSSPAEILDLFQSVSSAAEADSGLPLRAGISRSFADPEGIHTAFREARAALEKTGREETVTARDEIAVQHLPRSEALVRETVDHIHENYMKSISLEGMAARARLSNFYFSKMFKQYIGSTFIDYLTAHRVEAAKKLLGDPRVNVKEVAPAVGYPDPNYFAKVFKRLTGLSPREFRDRRG